MKETGRCRVPRRQRPQERRRVLRAEARSQGRGSTVRLATSHLGPELTLAPRGTYRAIADDLRQLVVSGDLRPGAMLPSELQLAEERSVSRGTVRAALAVLLDEGLIEVVPGMGRRVADGSRSREPMTAWERVAASLRVRLDAREFGTSTPLPSEAELVAEHGVSRNTVRRAYKELVDEGLVVIRHGAGAFPAPR